MKGPLRNCLREFRGVYLLLIAAASLSVDVARAAVITWTNTSGGNWSVATNWSPNQIPGASDNVFITNSGTYSVSLDGSTYVGNLTIGGTTGTQTMAFSGNILNIGGQGTAFSNGVVNMDGAVNGSFYVYGAMNWSAGYLEGTLAIQTNGAVNVIGAGTKIYSSGSVVTNRGMLTWSGGAISSQGVSDFYNEPGGTLNIQCNQSMQGGTIYNRGVLEKSGSSGTNSIQSTILNSGLITNSTGTLVFSDSGSMNGAVAAGPGATIQFASVDAGTFVLDGAFYAAAGGTIDFAGVYFVFDIGTPNFSGPGNIGFSGGLVYFTVPIVSFTLSAGNLAGTNTVAGTLNWTGGSTSDALTILSNGVLNITGPGTKMPLHDSVITNLGTVVWSGGSWSFQPCSFFNQPGALVDVQCDQYMAGVAFYNAGTYLKSAGSGGATNYEYFVNTGSVSNLSGQLWFQDGGTIDGSVFAGSNAVIHFFTGLSGQGFTIDGVFSAALGGAILFEGGPFVFDSMPDFQGPGVVSVESASARFTIPITNLTWEGALSGTNVVSGILNLTNGGSVGGALTIAMGAVLNVSCTNTFAGVMTYGTTLTNYGTVNWLRYDYVIHTAPGAESAIYNEPGAVFDVQCDRFLGTGSFYNLGTFRKSAGTGSATNYMFFENVGSISNLSGTLWFQNGGNINGAVFSGPGASIIFFTGLSGDGFGADGTFIAAPGGSIVFGGGPFTFDHSPNFQGSGTIDTTGAAATFLTPITNVTWNSTLSGTNLVAGTLNLVSGASFGGVLTVASNAVLNVNTPVDGLMGYGAILTNFGTVNWLGSQFIVHSAPGYVSAIYNQTGAVFDIQCDEMMGRSLFFNDGLFRKSSGTGTTLIGMDFFNTGTIEVLSGTLQLGQYPYDHLAVSNSTHLRFDLRGERQFIDFGQLAILPAISLAGTLDINFTNGFAPFAGDTFRLISWSEQNGGYSQENGLAINTNLFAQAICDRSGMSLVVKSSAPPTLPPVTNLVDQTVADGDSAAFFAPSIGQDPFTYQWTFYGTNLPAQNGPILTITNVQAANEGPYCVIVVDAYFITNTYCANLHRLTPPNITTAPVSQTVTNGTSNVVLTVVASGSSPLSYQWQLNGANIIGATTSSLTFTNLQPQDGGTYGVIVNNAANHPVRTNAVLKVQSPALPFADNFASRGSTNSFAGVGSGNNTNTTYETGEPEHDNLPGTNSVWLEWIAPANGVVTFNTRGSSFDTLLAAYTGSSVSNLNPVVADDDRGGYFTSQIQFQVTNGSSYEIAVDGLGGARGDIVLSWNLDTNITLLPRIEQQPDSVTTSAGASVSFSTLAVSTTNLSYQWYFNCCLAIPGATNATLNITNVSVLNIGTYRVEVTAGGQTVRSDDAQLEIGQGLSYDKFAVLLADLGVLHRADAGFPAPSIGTLGTQLINNFNSTTDQGEPIHSSTVGGSSRWYELNPLANGTMIVDTIGSDIDTVLAIYTGSDIFSLKQIASDNNGAPDGIRSRVTFLATNGVRYLIAVDGVNGAQGNINVNWRFGNPPAPATGPATNFSALEGTALLITTSSTNGFPPPTFQWRLNGANIAGATNSSYAVPSLKYTNNGLYTVVVSNLVGLLTNTVATVSLQVPLRLDLDSSSGSAKFRIEGTATQAVAIQISTNLRSWTNVFTNANPNAALNYLDALAPSRAAAFYRLVRWP